MKDVGAISPSFLPLQVFEGGRASSHPYYTGFLGACTQRTTSIERNLLVSRTGGATPDWSQQEAIDPLINDFRLLQYDMMFGNVSGRSSASSPESLPRRGSDV